MTNASLNNLAWEANKPSFQLLNDVMTLQARAEREDNKERNNA